MGRYDYINDFFNEIELEADEKKGHSYKAFLSGAIEVFFQNESKENAKNVFSVFLDIYKLYLNDSNNFIDLLDVLIKYEESMGTISDKQRDHYVHSINVFLFGIMIYSQNSNYRNCFKKYVLSDKSVQRFKNINEEFLFRWGFASLFHDIGYPVEMVNLQLNKYFGFVMNDENDKKGLGPFIDYKNFACLNTIKGFNKRELFLDEQIDKNSYEGYEKITHIIAKQIARIFKIDYIQTKIIMDSYLETMQNHSFVDHGFYSAIIMLKWYGEIMNEKEYCNNAMFEQVLDAATAIFMHNAYKNVFQADPFNLASMEALDSPISFLLILCDELQEWNRKVYGETAKDSVQIDNIIDTYIDSSLLKIHYVTTKGFLNDSFCKNKSEQISRIINTNTIFDKGIILSVTDSSNAFVRDFRRIEKGQTPRIIIDHLEVLAKVIHEEYNAKLCERNNGNVELTQWDALNDSLKYSNMRQAMGIIKKVEYAGFYVSEDGYPGDEVRFFDESVIEELAIVEHNEWLDERKRMGWKYGEKKDVENKISPYMISYSELPESIKELDRDTVRNIIPLMNKVGLKVYKQYNVNDFEMEDDKSAGDTLQNKMDISVDYIETLVRNYIRKIQELRQNEQTKAVKETIDTLFEKIIDIEKKGDDEWEAHYIYAEYLFESGDNDAALRIASRYLDHAEKFEQEYNCNKIKRFITKIYRSI